MQFIPVGRSLLKLTMTMKMNMLTFPRPTPNTSPRRLRASIGPRDRFSY